MFMHNLLVAEKSSKNRGMQGCTNFGKSFKRAIFSKKKRKNMKPVATMGTTHFGIVQEA